MAAGYLNLYLDQGTTFNTTITLDDVYGNNYDLTHITCESKIKKSHYSSNATAHFTTQINVPSGTITLELSANTTANIASGRYVYDTIITDTNSMVKTKILEGVLEVAPSVTR
jgi:hypothetical protein